jgi:hypothetical protein
MNAEGRLGAALEAGRALCARARLQDLSDAEMRGAKRAAEAFETLLSGLMQTAYDRGRSAFDMANVKVENGELSVLLWRRAECLQTGRAETFQAEDVVFVERTPGANAI